MKHGVVLALLASAAFACGGGSSNDAGADAATPHDAMADAAPSVDADAAPLDATVHDGATDDATSPDDANSDDDAPVEDTAPMPLQCGTMTCATNQVCIHPCCGSRDAGHSTTCTPNDPFCATVCTGSSSETCTIAPACTDVPRATCTRVGNASGCDYVLDHDVFCACL